MRACFVDHSYHNTTKSTRFVWEALSRVCSHVDEFFIYPGKSESEENELVDRLSCSDYDHYVFFQTEDIASRLIDFGLSRFTIIPMYDGAVGRPDLFWQQFTSAQFLSFSRTLHETFTRLQCKSAYFQYVPPIGADISPRVETISRDAFFWERRPDTALNLALVETLCRQLRITSLHVHQATDPLERNEPLLPSPISNDPSAIRYSTSSWFKSHEEYRNISSLPLFFFAPRISEGIGMATLEAMSRGQIVVAPDVPTMNEYISHGVSGILYDVSDPKIVTQFSDADLLGMSRGAARKARSVRAAWENDLERFESYLSNDGRRWSTPDSSAHFVNRLRKSANAKRWSDQTLLRVS